MKIKNRSAELYYRDIVRIESIDNDPKIVDYVKREGASKLGREMLKLGDIEVTEQLSEISDHIEYTLSYTKLARLIKHCEAAIDAIRKDNSQSGWVADVLEVRIKDIMDN